MPRKKKKDYRKYYLHEETGFSIREEDIGNFPASSLIIVSPSDWYKRRPVKAVLYGEKEYAFYDSPDMFDKIGTKLITESEWANNHLLDAETGEPTALRGDELALAEKTGKVLHRDVRIKRVNQLKKELGNVPLDLIAKFKDRKELRPDLYRGKKRCKPHKTKRVTMKKTIKHSVNQDTQEQVDVFDLDNVVNREKLKPHFDFSSANTIPEQKNEIDQWVDNLIIADSSINVSLTSQGFFSTNAKTLTKEHLKQKEELNIKPKPV